MSTVSIELSGRDAGAAAVIKQYDDATLKNVLTLKQLDLAIKQVENSTLRLTMAQQASTRATTAQVAAETRAATAMQANHVRRMSLRHGDNIALSQTMRQMIAQGATGGVASGMIAQGQDAQFQRWLLAQRMKSERNTLRTATTRIAFDALSDAHRPRFTDRHRQLAADLDALDHQQWDTAGMVNRAGQGYFARGGGIEGDDRMMRRARQAVARNLARMPEIAARVTSEELETMSRRMAQTMQQRITGRREWMGIGRTALTAGAMTATVGGMALVGAANKMYAERDQAGQETTNAAVTRRELRQLADTQADYDRLLKASGVFRDVGGYSATDANNAIFSARSAGISLGDATRLAPLLKGTSLNPSLAFRAVQKIQSNFGASAGTPEQILGAFIRASEPAPDTVNDLVGAIGTAASAWRGIGGTWDELVAGLGAEAGPNKNMEQTAERIKSMAMQLQKKSANIDWGGETPLKGRSLVLALPRLLAAGRLKDERGRTVSSANDFFGEQLAKTAMDTAIQLAPVSADIMNKIASDRATGTSVLAQRAGFRDPQSDAVTIKDRAEQREKQAMERGFANSSNLLQAAHKFQSAWMIEQDQGVTGWLKRQGVWVRNWVQRARGDVNALNSMFANRHLNDPELLRQFFALQYEGMDKGMLQAMRQTTERSVKYTVPKGIRPKQREAILNPAQMQISDAVIDELIRQKTPEATAYTGPMQQFPGMPTTGIVSMKDISAKIFEADAGMGDLKWGIGQQVLSAYGIEADPRLRPIAEDIIRRRMDGTSRNARTAFLEGRPGDANALLRGTLDGFDGEFGEQAYRDNLALIDESIAGAEKDAASGDSFISMRGSRRLKALKSARDQALQDDGVMDDAEAADIARQIKGTNELVDAMRAIAGPIREIARTLNQKAAGGGIPVSEADGFPGGTG
jgi:hypothetical protein